MQSAFFIPYKGSKSPRAELQDGWRFCAMNFDKKQQKTPTLAGVQFI